MNEPIRHSAIVANRTINLAIRDGELPGWEAFITVEQAHYLISKAIEFDRSERFGVSS